MFDAVEIGRRISRLRKEKDMTQPALADCMGVSFQAVSNWERGASMPDIGKLPELAQALGVSVDELLGGGRGGELIRSVMDGSEESFVKTQRVTLSEVGEAAPLLKPRQVKRIVRAIEEETEQRKSEAAGEDETANESNAVSFESLLALAPFLEEDYLDELAGRLVPDVGIGRLAALAPYLSEEALGKLAQNAIQSGGSLGELAAIAPFLDEDVLGKLAQAAMARGGTLGEVAAIAPFLDEDDLGSLALSCVEGGGSVAQVAAVAPFLEEDDLDKIVKAALKQGQRIGELAGLFPFLSEESLRALVEDALKRNDTGSLTKITKFL
jgi:transcriptional regulator with XRE-family HTH domain